MSYLLKKFPFNPPRPAPSMHPAPNKCTPQEAHVRKQLKEINNMISIHGKTKLLMQRKAELEKELASYTAPKQAQARAKWQEVMEKRRAIETR